MRALHLLLLALSLLASCSVRPDEDFENEGSDPDFPNAAMEWRALRWADENGAIPAGAWARALQQRQALVAASPLSDTGGIAPKSWVERGPYNLAGRSRTLVIDPRDTRILWSGGVSGGLWKSVDRGANWSIVDDWWTNLSIGSLTLDPSNPDVMYAGTGEGFFNINVARGVNRSAIRGAGIFKSIDGGAHWTWLTNTAGFDYVLRVAVSPANPNVVLASVRQGGIYRSTDGGTNWSQVYNAYSSDQVVFDPNNGNNALAHVVDASLSNHGVLWSTDGGATWAPAQSGLGLITGYDARVEMCYARSSPNVVYASCGASGGKAWRSADGGRNWVQRTTTSSTGVTWYFNGFWVDPTNENVMVAAGLHVWRSTNGGVSFSQITNGYIMTTDPHLDVHAVVADPDYDGATHRRVYVTTDGGVHAADDVLAAGQGTGWRDIDNTQRSTQFYGAAGSATNGTIVGGAQDNGTQRLLAGAQNSNMPFGGDGGQVEMDPTNPNYVYGEYVWLQVHRSTNGGSSSAFQNSGITETADATANFVAPIALDPNSPLRLYGGASSLWRTTNARATTIAWSAIKAPVGSKISAIAIANGDPNLVWVAHNDGRIYKTTNATAATPTWTAVDDNAGVNPLPNRYVTRIAIDPTNHAVVWLTFGGFTSGNLRVTRNGGTTWTDASGTSPRRLPDVPCNCVLLNPDDTNVVYVATEIGIFASDDAGATWSASNDGPANVDTEQIVFMHGSRTIIASTLGRGLWTCDVRRPTSAAFGAACANQSNPPQLVVDPLAPARIGHRLQWIGSNSLPGVGAFLLLGFSKTAWLGGSLPFDLTGVGMASCSLLVSPDAVFGTATSASGGSSFGIDLPQDPSLLGASLHAQLLSQDPTLNLLGLATSAGVSATLGW
ncbi:MAG: hypothetical protein U1F36_18650 [Planctomycetota bacterium]